MSKQTQRVGYVLLISVIIVIGVYSEVAYSQAGPNYQIERSVLDAGGGERSSTKYRLTDSLGQLSTAAVSTAPKLIHTSGFSEASEQGNPGSGSDPVPTAGPPIPEPGTVILFGTGVFGLLILMRRKLRKRN